MHIKISNIMGCESADITAGHIALIGGRNAQGKSSICRSVAYALAGQPVPQGLTKAACGVLVRSGAAKGRVEVIGQGGTVAIDYPKAILSSDGDAPPRASIWAAGLKTVAELPEKERVEILRDLIGAKPTRDDLAAAIRDSGVPEKHTDPIWKLIEVNGWDAAHKQAQDKGREIKAQWEYAAGEKYGEKKAESWLPQNWSAGIENASRDSLEAIITGARADLDAAIADSAVAEDRVAALREKAAQISVHEGDLANEQDALETSESKLAQAKAVMDTMPTGQQRRALACPHCDGAVFFEKVIGGESLIKAEGLLDADELASQLNAFKAQQGLVAELSDEVKRSRQSVAATKAALAAAQAAANELAALPQSGGRSQAEIDAAREALRVAEHDLKAWVQKTEADRLHRAVQANQQIVDILSPDGVRRKSLVKALESFNAKLADIAGQCGWSGVAVSGDLDTEYNQRPYILLSESEQFRVRVTLQLAIAEIDQSAAVVIDGADVLDAAGRQGLFNALRARKQAAVVGMMANRADLLPSMADAGCGQTYWVESGNAGAIA